ncbi:MAG: hypothetical protein A3D21_02005 [Nitrospirae bacterium RIFCSPHIGHO2_02_FULL_42_12]|nr:MAG: hypothetical protein A3D21_02005 [Nitrospirae bacterium RIFCSPHIGHO2_02_FULL_42_12]
MTVKDVVKQVIDTLPDESTIDDIIHALYINAKFNHGESEIREGKGIPHEDAKKKLQKWIK